MKSRSIFYCQECGATSPRWMGRCSSCGLWNTLVEDTAEKKAHPFAGDSLPVQLASLEPEGEERISTGMGEFDRVLGGGLVGGSLVLLGGDPGIGKSTLLLQVSHLLAGRGEKVLYITGEESVRQVYLRAGRLGALSPHLFVLAETSLHQIENCLSREMPALAIIDSIQTVASEEIPSPAGSVAQVRESAARLMRLCKAKNIAMFLVGHVTKGGMLAGPKVLEHMVDTVLYFEGDRHHTNRILRAVKNRFGSTDEIGVYGMEAAGLVEVANPSALFLTPAVEKGVTGAVVVPVLEGSRPFLVEIQALVSPSGFSVPRRMTAGVDYNRAVLMLAVLEKRIGLRLSGMDAYVNAVGGMRLEEPAADLGIAVAVVSSFREVPVARTMAVMGEIGLTGEIRPVPGVVQRLREARRLGFETFVLPRANLAEAAGAGEEGLIGVNTLKDAIEEILPV